MATQRESKSENLKKIQVLEPPQIDVRTEPKLVGTNGMVKGVGQKCRQLKNEISTVASFVN